MDATLLFIIIIMAFFLPGTYKLKKLDLQKEGYNPDPIDDPLYFLSPSTGTFVPLTSQLYKDIISGKQRL